MSFSSTIERVSVAIGDPQAPLEKFFGVLTHNGLLSEEGWLRPEVHLVSMGDHFDWIGPSDVTRASVEAPQLLAWLAAHSPEQVTILAGNHDLARVGELAPFDDGTWANARADAKSLSEAQFIARYPSLPTREVATRDFASFSSIQKSLVTRLLRAGRLRLAYAPNEDLLLTHAGVTTGDLARVGIPAESNALDVAQELNLRFDRAISHWDSGPLAVPGLHRPGSASWGEARGICFHRPSNPETEDPALFAGSLQRRYDPRTLPRHFTQAIGHIRDSKCRKLFGPWVRDEPEQPGKLRSLRLNGEEVRYEIGLQEDASLIFLDGEMGHTDPAGYELLNLVGCATRPS